MSSRATIRHHYFPVQDEVIQAIVDQVLQIAESSIKTRRRFRLALTGGRSAEKLYQQLQRSTNNFECWEFWFGDERFLPEDHPDRNSLMASQALFEKEQSGSFFSIPYEKTPELSALDYQEQIMKKGALPFDLVLLSLGEDGHIASLFPGHRHDSEAAVIAVEDAPKDPPSRISLTIATLSNCRNMIIMATGVEKQDALTKWRSGEKLPVATLNPECGIDLFTDQ